MAKRRDDKKIHREKKSHTSTIYKRKPTINDETAIHHTPLLFFSPPLRSWANSRRHDGDAPCVTAPLTHLSHLFFFPSFPRWNMPTSKAPQQQKHSTILRSGFGFMSLQIQSTWIIISTAGRQEEVQIWRCGINAVYIVKPFSKALWSLSQRGSNQSSPQHWSSIKSASPRSSIFSRSCFIFICLLNNWSKAREEIHKFPSHWIQHERTEGQAAGSAFIDYRCDNPIRLTHKCDSEGEK